MKLFISPHSDDSVLFGAFTLMRELPLVLTVTDSWIQFNRGDNITAEQRRLEDIEAMKILGCGIVFGGIRDDIADEWAVRHLLEKFQGFDEVYVPAQQGGNPIHDLVGKVAHKVFNTQITEYCNYTPTELYTTGSEEIKPTHEELILKRKAMECYKSQHQLPSTKPHFQAVDGRSEWFI